MQLKRLSLENFRNYKGNRDIIFSTDKDHNVTIVIAENGAGKTTLTQAFQWCLYGTTEFADKGMLNKLVINEMDLGETRSVSVTINLEHLGREYKIKRTQNYKKDSSFSVKGDTPTLDIVEIDNHGNSVFHDPSENLSIINSILPSTLSKYFFFTGERIDLMAKDISNGKSSEFKDAVQNILGLTALNKAMEHLNPKSSVSVIGRYNKQIDDNSNQKAKELRNAIYNNEDKIKKCKIRLEELEESIKSYEREIDDIKEKLLSYKDAQRQQEQLNILKKDLDVLINHRDTAIGELSFMFSSTAYKYFSKDMIKEALDVLKDTESIDKGIPDIRNTTIDYLLHKTKKCICGQDLSDENSEAVKNLIDLLKYIPPQSIGNSINNFQNNVKYTLRNSEGFIDNFTNKLSSIRGNEKQIEEIEHNIGKYNESLLNSTNSQISDLKRTQEDYEKTLNRMKTERDGLIGDIRIAENIIQSSTKEISDIELKEQRNNQYIIFKHYAQAVYDMIESAYSSEETKVRNNLETEINKLFESIYDGGITIDIDSNYKINSYVNDMMDVTSGLEANTAKSYSILFAFIVGIIKMAKEKVAEKKANNNSIDAVQNDEFPLVMDAPLSSFDQRRIDNICSVIPEIANQVIMFINTKDGRIAKEQLKNKIGIEYKMELINDQVPLDSKIDMVSDSFNQNGKVGA